VSASRTERLLALALVLINSNRPLSRSELRQAVRDYPSGGKQEAFERMFERDKDELRSMGLPIESVEIDEQEGVGYLLSHREAFLPSIEVDESESLALALASRMWQEATWSHAATTGLRKLELVGGFAGDTDLAFNVSMRVDSATLTALLSAAQEKRDVSFDYRTAIDSATQRRHLQPWGVVAARGQWYVVGHDLDRAATRAFRLSRISGRVALGKSADAFTGPDDVDLRELVLTQVAPTRTITVSGELMPGRATRLRQLATALEGDVATFVDIDPELILTEVLRAGPDVRVLEPQGFIDQVTTSLTHLSTATSGPLSATDRAALDAEIARRQRNPIESSVDQLGRLLALVPWLRAHPGITYELAADHFGVDVNRLHKDLELAVCTEFGSNLLTLDIEAWGNTIHVRDPQGIQAPLRFTESEGFSLLVGLDLLAQIPGPHDLTAVATVSEKLRIAVGETADLTRRLAVDPPSASAGSDVAAVREAIVGALDSQKAIDIQYFSISRDEISTRIVDPMGLLTTEGATYLQAWCRQAEAVRLFRLDRISGLTVLEDPSNVPHDAGPLLASIIPDGETAVFELDSSISWWADHVPHQAVVTTESGALLVELAVSSEPWAIRTAMGLGGKLAVREPTTLAEAIRARSAAALANYPV
jgi:predicted DNA-binding transcriptional regulator YafY